MITRTLPDSKLNSGRGRVLAGPRVKDRAESRGQAEAGEEQQPVATDRWGHETKIL